MSQRIVVATSALPFGGGGSMVQLRQLVRAVRELGHRCEPWVLPQNRFGRQGAAYAAAFLTDLGCTARDEPVDRVISLRYPAYALRHPRHVVWLCHRLRAYYDLWDQHRDGLAGPWPRVKEAVRRRAVHGADRFFLRRTRRVFAISHTVADRLQRWGGIPAEVLYPPAPVRAYRSEPSAGYILAVSRLTPHKRLDLLVEALGRSRSGLEAVLVGEGPERGSLEGRIRELGLEERVRLLGHADEEELVDLYARCLAVYFAPLQEDLGLVTWEAFASGRPVVTCADSGGPTELVRDGVSGRVVLPEAGALAEALDALAACPEEAAALGEEGREMAESRSWVEVARRLVEA